MITKEIYLCDLNWIKNKEENSFFCQLDKCELENKASVRIYLTLKPIN